MTTFINYLNSWWETKNDSPLSSPNEPSNKPEPKPIMLISSEDLLSVKLKPVKNIIPAPARNMPLIDKSELHRLNQAQLKEILSIKLRPISIPAKKLVFEHRHPVLRELLKVVPRK